MTVGFLALGFGGLVLARTAQWAVGSLPSLILTETHFVFAIRDPSFWVLTRSIYILELQQVQQPGGTTPRLRHGARWTWKFGPT